MLEVFGQIEETCPTSVTDQEIAGLPEGTYVKFAYFQDCRDAIIVSPSASSPQILLTASRHFVIMTITGSTRILATNQESVAL